MTVTDLLIIYTDFTRKTIAHVESYGHDNDMFWFTKHGYISFLPKENVVYFGREFDYENKELRQKGEQL